jgi:YVTN family beta-propeller protein
MSTVRGKLLGLRRYEPTFAVSVVDVATDQTVADTIVGTNPWIVGVNTSTNRIYVANYASHSVSVMDGETNTVIATIDVGFFRTPDSIAIEENTNRVYVATTQHVGPVDFGKGQLLVIDGETNEVLGSQEVGRRGHVDVNERTNRLYVSSRRQGTLSVLNGDTGETIATLAVGPEPCALAVGEQANRVYVANCGGHSVSVIDGDSNRVLQTIGVGDSPRFVAVNETTGKVYVSNSGDDTLSVLGPAEPASG